MLRKLLLLGAMAAAMAQDGGLYAEYARAREARSTTASAAAVSPLPVRTHQQQREVLQQKQQAKMLRKLLLLGAMAAAMAQDGGLYAEYARAREARPAQRGEMLKTAGWFGLGFGISHLWARAAKRKLRKDHKETLRRYAQALLEANGQVQQLSNELYQRQIDDLEQDYSEFKAPDSNGDDQITKPEFMAYMRQYVASQPGLSLSDFPTFEEWDLNSNGKVTFKEWQEVMEFLEAGGQTASQATGGTKNLYA
eukprot:CAMPEP_0118888280 /NCGR_PEP_ID=MMETSP1163-20130328/25639_1 /TAXON_ID=124430 /ORGANISM="Phaeomonas parva, Strain CCMP2877" /LENGTH=251 /DNA_ID=CAMNT_0006826843 /DNA_START=439 /DNA_END=1196 /DNA_ORIENTATION=+